MTIATNGASNIVRVGIGHDTPRLEPGGPLRLGGIDIPHPPLMPVDPVSRAQLRLVHYRVLKDWYSLVYEIESSTGKKAEQAAKQLKEGIIAANELFSVSDYILSDELSLVDCTLGPLMWRLAHYGVKLGKPGASVEAYAHRVFSRASFKSSLTQAERDLMLAS